MTQKQICNILEIVRWLCIIAGFNLAYFSSQDPAGQLHIIMPWLVIPLAGLTGIESVFLGKTASELSGYGYNPAYQRQSGMNNIAVAITAIIVSFFKWGNTRRNCGTDDNAYFPYTVSLQPRLFGNKR